MLIVVPDVLTKDEIRKITETVKDVDFADGRETAGARTQAIKNNLQTHDNTDPELQALVLAALQRNGLFNTVAAPQHILPPRGQNDIDPFRRQPAGDAVAHAGA